MTEGETAVTERRSQSPVVRTRLFGAAAALAAAVLAVVGSFLPLVSGELSLIGGPAARISVTGWEVTAGGATPSAGHVAENGIPLTIAAALLGIAVLMIIAAAQRAAPAAVGFAALLAGSVAAAFLVGVLATVAVQVVNLRGTIQAADGASAALGAGFWLVLAAGVLASAAVVLIALPVRGNRLPGPPGDSPER